MKSPTTLNHPWHRFYKSHYLKKEVVIGLHHEFNPDKCFWLAGIVQEVGPDSLLLEHFDGRILSIYFDAIKVINLYSRGYFEKRGLKDPKEKFRGQ